MIFVLSICRQGHIAQVQHSVAYSTIFDLSVSNWDFSELYTGYTLDKLFFTIIAAWSRDIGD